MKFTGRYIFVSIILLVIVGIMGWRVISLQVFERNFLSHQGEARTVRVVSQAAYRGMILDRNGEPLAISTPVDSVWINPKEFDYEHPELLTLASTLDISLNQIMDKERHKGKEFVYLQRHITPQQAETIKTLKINGIHLKQEYRRYYPAGEVTAHVLGFNDVDDHGQEGLELIFDKTLSGVAGSKRVIKDRLGREVQIIEGLKDMQSGENIVLSIDQRLQYLAYRELKAACLEHQTEAGSAVILNVQTGEILAMVNQPSFNPNLRVRIYGDGRYRNRAVTDKFEPGSVMKTFSVVSALQNGRITPNTLIDTSPGWIKVGSNVVKEIDNRNFGLINVATILQKSSNVGVSKLTLSLPPERLYETYANLGFGSPTGSGFPGESSGSLLRTSKQGFVLATQSFGYAMSVTPLQLAQAYAVLGAGGIKRHVTFLKQSGIPAGERVIDATVAHQVVSMLTSVVRYASGMKAQVVGYDTAGKTGTTRKIDQNGAYLEDSHVAIFAGLAPSSHPKFAIVVMLDDPKGKLYYGSQVAAPVFSKIAGGALRLYNIPPDNVNEEDLQVAQFNNGSLQE